MDFDLETLRKIPMRAFAQLTQHVEGLGSTVLPQTIFRRVAKVALIGVLAAMALMWAWFQIKALVYGAITVDILVGIFALKKRLF